MSSTSPASNNALVRVALFGATGFIGLNLARYLCERGVEVVAVLRDGREVPAVLAASGARIATESNYRELVGEGAAHTVAINLAAARYDAAKFQHYQADIFSQNVDIATRFYRFCVMHDISEVRFASSIAVYPQSATLLQDSAPLDTNEYPAQSERMYGVSKRISEEVAALYHAQYGVHSQLFRLSNPYGPHDSLSSERAHVLAAFVIRALTTQGDFTMRGGADATRDFIYVGDVCEVFYRSLSMRGVQAAFNLATGENTRISTLAQRVLALTTPAGAPPRNIVTEGSPTSSVVHRVCDVSRLKAQFALEHFTSLDEGLQQTIDWYRGNV
jgi:nucleoside-diphosphate-sugar epimerase